MLTIGVLFYGKVIINGLCPSLAKFVETIVRLLEFVRLRLADLDLPLRLYILGRTF